MEKQFTFGDYEEKPKETIPKGYTKVTFLKYVPKFVGIDSVVRGSFNVGDVAIIPDVHIIGLVKKGGCMKYE